MGTGEEGHIERELERWKKCTTTNPLLHRPGVTIRSKKYGGRRQID